jgi:hypothetical protein
MPRRRLLLAPLLVLALTLTAGPSVTSAQQPVATPQLRYIDELKQRNAAYGPGCNGIGISLPLPVDTPANITGRWTAGHSACVPGMRLMLSCLGQIVDTNRVIGCTLRVADGQAPRAIGCADLTLITAAARVTPDPALSDALAVGSEGGSLSCTKPHDLTTGAAIAAAFVVPAADSGGDLALLIDLDGSEVPAFLIPAAQLAGAPAGS